MRFNISYCLLQGGALVDMSITLQHQIAIVLSDEEHFKVSVSLAYYYSIPQISYLI